MADKPQVYANHTRWHAPYHFFLVPVLLINVIWTIIRFVMEPGWDKGWAIIVALALMVMGALVRTYPLKAQDRIIRLEEQLRFQRVLPAELARQAGALPFRQLVALRFAPDDELASLVRKVLDGSLSKSVEIKQAIRSWRGDLLRV